MQFVDSFATQVNARLDKNFNLKLKFNETAFLERRGHQQQSGGAHAQRPAA